MPLRVESPRQLAWFGGAIALATPVSPEGIHPHFFIKFLVSFSI